MAAKIRLELRGARRRLGRGRPALGARYVAGRGAREGARSPAPGRWSSRSSRTSRGSSASRARRSTPRAGTTTSTCTGKRVASIGTGASAIQYVPAIAPDVEQLYVIQRTPPWVMPHSARPSRASRSGCTARVPAAQRALRGAIYAGARAAGARLRQAAEGHEAAREGRRASTASARCSDPALIAQDDARLHPRLQAHPALQRLVSGARARQRRAGHRGRRRGPRALDRDRRRPRARGRRARLRHRLPRRRHARRAARARPRRPRARRRLGRLARARTSAPRSPASRTSSSCSARTPGSGTTRWST